MLGSLALDTLLIGKEKEWKRKFWVWVWVWD
jgi:hypothetical protein